MTALNAEDRICVFNRHFTHFPYAGGMRWFTRAWFRGDLGDDDYEAVFDAYWIHVKGLFPTAPSSVRELAQLSLHDARFERVTIDPEGRAVGIHLIGGDLQLGYYSLDLLYCGAMLQGMVTSRFKRLVERSGSEIIYDEVDMHGPGEYEHRFLIWPNGEFAIRFEDVGLTRTGANDRQYADAVGRVTLVNTQ